MPRFRPAVLPLEARDVPTVNVLYTGTSLTLTGTPTAGPNDTLMIANVGGNNFKVTDGAVALGTYHVTRDVRVRLTSFNTFVDVELAGATLTGNVDFDLGAGLTDPASGGGAWVGNASGVGRVLGDVTFRGGVGTEYVGVGGDGSGAAVVVGGDIKAAGKPVATPIEDTLFVGFDTEVRGDVSATRYTYTTIYGTVDGDVVSNAADSPGGMGFEVGRSGVVHGNVTATGGATAKGYYSYAHMYGAVDGDVRLNLTGGRAIASVFGTIGGDWAIRHTGGGFATCFVAGAGVVNGDLSCTATDNGSYDETDVYVENVVRGDLGFRQLGTGGISGVYVDGLVAGEVNVDLGGPTSYHGEVVLDGVIGKSATITGQSKSVNVHVFGVPGVAEQYWMPNGTTVTGDLTVKLGDGANSLDIEQLDPSVKTIGGKLKYTGGTGADIVHISGKFGFRAKIDTGGGDDTVSMAPDAVVGALDIDFGKLPGKKTWTPPDVISFPLKIKNLT